MPEKERDKTQTPAQAAKEAVKEAEPKPDETALPVELLIEEAPRRLGYNSADAAGAFFGVNRQTLTVTEAKAAIAKWLKTEVS